jgi:hypothetical protein
MKKRRRIHGPSRYYASDKNVFDALNQHKVDIPTIMGLFERRNIIVSNKTPREDLAKYFARQIHDYQDHKDIAARLGIAPRRERITFMDLNGVVDNEHLQVAVDQLKNDLEQAGEAGPRHSGSISPKAINHMICCDLSCSLLPSCRPSRIPNHSIVLGQTRFGLPWNLSSA